MRPLWASEGGFKALFMTINYSKVGDQMSHSLNSLKWGYIGDCIGDYYRGY